MSKRRRSLQNLLIPTFTRQRSNTELHDYPPLDFASSADDLLDDDPFANLASPSVSSKPPILPPPPPPPPTAVPSSPPSAQLPPRSPLSANCLPPPVRSPSLPSKRHAVPAYQRPAFSPRPSLPSLHTLAKMSVVMPRKVRKGKVGAGLPSEPWDSLPSDPLHSPEHIPSTDFVSDLDISDEEEILTEDDEDDDTDCLPLKHSDRPSRRLSRPSLSDHFRTPSLSAERPSVAWPALDQSTRVSPDSEISTPAFPDFEDFETNSTSPPTTSESDTSSLSDHSSEDETISAPLPSWTENRTRFVGDTDISSEMNAKDGNHMWRGRPLNGAHVFNDSPPQPVRNDGDHSRRLRRSSASSEESDEERQRGVASAWNSSAANSEDDDVPLAQRIPTALHAQKTIRKQVQDERQQRRKERYFKRLQEQQQQQSPLPPGSAPQPRLSRRSLENDQARMRHDTIRAVAPPNPVFPSNSQDAAMYPAEPLAQPRARTRTLPGKPIVAADLAHKLSEIPPDHQASSLTRKPTRINPPVPVSPLPKEAGPSLRHARSFHRPSPRTHDVPPIPLSRSGTRSKSTTRHDEGRRRTSAEFEPPLPEQAYRLGRNKSLARRTEDDTGNNRPPLPPLPVEPPVPMVTHRIHVANLQTFSTVEVAPNTNAKDIIITMETQGKLNGWAGAGGWMVWEVCQDLGVERPIRTFELLVDIAASWKDKTANHFILKMTPLAPLLSRSNLPTSSPICSGYLEYESKRGKWSKRHLRLRENNLYIAKRDTGKDETFLCSLSNFDGYLVTRSHKAPKPFVFAIRSTDNLTFFENTNDYMHVFSCNQKDGDNWIAKILLARSYVLYQEKNILFTAQSSVAGPANLQRSGTTLQRSGTRKGPAQAPLIDVAPPQLFEPGSLLHAKHN